MYTVAQDTFLIPTTNFDGISAYRNQNKTPVNYYKSNSGLSPSSLSDSCTTGDYERENRIRPTQVQVKV